MSSTHTLQLQQNNHNIMSAREDEHQDVIMKDTGKAVCDTSHKDSDMDIDSTKQTMSMAELEMDFFHLMNKSIQINDEWNKKKKEKGLSFDLEGLLSSSALEDVPVFLTCDKCSLVFGDKQEAWTHEENCTHDNTDIIQGGKFFDNKNLLIQFIIDYQTSKGKVLNEDDKVYFVSSEEYINYQELNQQEDRESQSYSKDVQAEEEKNDTDKQNTHEEEDDGDYDTADMNLIQHLCSTTIDPKTGLPTQKFTVMCGDSETLYDFRVDVKQSSIPNAGYGAFLTYLGARVLKNKAEERSTRLIKQHIVDDNDIGTHEELVAQTLGGRTMNVKLTGENLHYNDNSLYWTKKRYKKYQSELSRRVSIESFDENAVDCAVHDEVERLRQRIPDGKGIGHLGIHKESDYRCDSSKPFWNLPREMFELGRYGPHRPEDRKIKLHFDIKNFIQNFEPSEWSYEVPEELMECPQMVDITDDNTGEVHEVAKKHTPIYVNEVGHNNKLHRNVFIRDKNQRSIYYYVGIDKEHALNKGDTVELLVNYGDHYEQVRERKGYGRKNESEKVGSDEEDDAARLRRNFLEREEAEMDISTLNVYEMHHLIEFLTDKVLDPINLSIRRACPAEVFEKSYTLRSRDLIARRRIHWIGEKLQGRYQDLLADKDVDGVSELMSGIQLLLDQWRFKSLPSIYLKLNEEIREALQHELTEELLYQTRNQIPNPLDERVWSETAVNLMNSATVLIGQYWFCYSGLVEVRKQFLAEKLLALAKNSALAIREGVNAIKNNETSELESQISSLTFKSPKLIIKKNTLVDENEKARDLYDIQDTIRNGTAASMADIQAYYDAIELCGCEPYYIPGKNKRVYDCERSIISQYEPRDNEAADTRSPQHHWMARSVDTIKRGDATVNEQWYIENQVLLVLHILASTCVDWSSDTSEDGGEEGATETWYSLEKLCAEINLDLDKAKRALSLGAIDPNWPPEDEPLLPDSGDGDKKKKKSRRVRRRVAVPKVVGFSDSTEFPGWDVKGVKRSTGNHIDNYWGHPDLPEGLRVRSKVGVRTLIDYAEANNCGIAEAYEEYKDVTKYYNKKWGA